MSESIQAKSKQLLISVSPGGHLVKPKASVYPKFIYLLFYLFSLYLVLPLYDVPLLGLSLSAPIFFVVAAAAILKPPRPWFRAYRGWIVIAAFFWIGIFISAVANGLLSGGVNIDTGGISLLIHYAYWMLIFVVTAYFASQGDMLKRISRVLGWGVLALALLRWLEVALYGNFGAWTGTHLLTQNTYGFLFSTFSPFLLVKILENRGSKKLLAVGANVLLWGAVAINGSRGSWIAIAIGLALCLIILLISRPGHFISLVTILLAIAFLAGSASVIFPQMASKVVDRFNTMQNLEQDKSYMIRQLMIQKGERLFLQSPVIGVGVGRFTKSSVPLDIPKVLGYAGQAHFDVKSSHNSYLDLLAESGLAGAVPFAVLLILLSWRGAKSAFRSSRKNRFWILAAFLGFVQMSIHMWAIASLTNTGNWFIYGLTAAAIVVANRKEVTA